MAEYKNASKIIGVQFSILSPEEIRRNSVVEVTSRDTYINNKPVIGGLFDPRMGVLEPGSICPTDGLTYIDTPGYFGHIELARPVFFVHHIKEIMKICRSVCFKCSKLLINKNQHKHILSRDNDSRWNYVCALASKIKRCGELTDDGCGCKQPEKIKLEGMSTIIASWSAMTDNDQSVDLKLTPESILKIFKRISDDDIHFMGFSPTWSKPEWMICQVLPVAPVGVRPSVKLDAQQRSEDDLTHIYSNIIKTNNYLKEKLALPDTNPNVIEMSLETLQHSIAMISNNKIKGVAPMAQRSGRPLQCISGRINGKNGRIRGNLMGKRVDYSARSVITGDPNLSIQQLGVPLKIAKNITKPVVVNERNRMFLLKMVQNGPEEYPGAKILERKNGENVSLRYVDRGSIELNNGDIVHRHMLDGDMCLFNRQPSLHRPSMMGHVAKIMKVGDTFRMNVGDTKPYNADFDGDEMNLHFPQNVVAETELRHLAAVPYQIISAENNTPIIGIFQDSLLGSYRFTRNNTKMTTRTAMNLLMSFSRVDVEGLKDPLNELTSFQVLSQILPKMSLKYKTSLFDDDVDNFETSNNVLEIKNGKLIRGQFDKSVLGSSSKSIIHRICNDYGNMACANFNDDLQNIITEYMKTSAFSVGISDLIANKKTQTDIVEVIEQQKQDVQKVIDKVHLGIFENNTAQSNMKEFETQVNNILNKATEISGNKGRKSLNSNNRFVMIVASGSKGTALNISQMISCLGQQNVDAKRIPYGFDSRTLPHYCKFDDSPTARGFIENSYISGLTAPELFFHAMGGRIGLIDTAVKTSQTGYIQRRLIKGLEDLKVEYDMTVRNNKGKIIQFEYGEDGFDSMKVENQSIPLCSMSIEDIYRHYDIDGINDQKKIHHIYTKAALKRMKIQKEETKNLCKTYINTMIDNRDNLVSNLFKFKNENGVRLPVAFQYIIGNINGQLNLTKDSAVDITPLEAFKLIEEYYNKLNEVHCIKTTELFKIMYFYYLSPRELLVSKRFHRDGLVMLLETILLKFKEAIVHPGEMVGVVAGQSVGAPTTQLTLNSVTYETEIVVRDKIGVITKHQIGDFIENGIKKSPKIDFNETQDTTYAEMLDYYEVPCANELGDTVWKRVEAVTRHPVVNKDGTNSMLRIKTKGNREVIATKAKSFLQLVDGKIQDVNGDQLKVGDYLPASRKSLDYNEVFTLDLRKVLPPNEYMYTSEIEKAKKVMNTRNWWKNNQSTTFTLPYSRCDSAKRVLDGKGQVQYVSGMVYTKTNNICNYEIPERIELDYDFGYLIGAYAAEGCVTRHQISISNNDQNYFVPIQRLCKKFNITTKIYVHNNKGNDGWTSTDIRIYNTLLTQLVVKMSGRHSHNKKLSSHIVFSNRQCILGFLDAYISGDGCVHQHKRRYGTVTESISITSTSRNLLVDTMVMMKNIGITGHITKNRLVTSNNRGTLPENIRVTYNLDIRNKQSQKLAKILNLTVKDKQEKMLLLLNREFKIDNRTFDDKFFPNVVNGELSMEERCGRMNDLEFDEIVSIEEVSNTTPYAYDLTVETTRNFDIYNGLCLRDTFHNSGTSSKSNVTRGVPRIEEILRLTKNPKNPSMTIYLKPEDEVLQGRADMYTKRMELTKLVDVVKSIQICFDPSEKSTTILEDRQLLEEFYEFENMVNECNGSMNSEESAKSKWVIRIEIDPEILLDKGITMDDIHFAISNSHFKNDAQCVFSDYNTKSKLIFRIRMKSAIIHKGKKSNAQDSLDQSDHIYLLKNFQDQLLNNIVLRGVSSIKNCLVRKLQNNVIKEDGKYVKKELYVLDTTGSNLLDTLSLDFIDFKRTHSNDIREIFDVLGIEAARQSIYNELNEVMEFSGVYINHHHSSLLCDRMTCNKDLVSIFRSGLLNDNIGPLAKATFEVHTEVLLKAARHADIDHMRGVSANVLTGQYGCYGTSAFQLVLDINAFTNIDNVVIDNQSVDLFSKLNINQNDEEPCSMRNIEIVNNISKIQETSNHICDDNYDMGF
jgi:DNA-directed RNA polymerase II subunit RPB1